jgi:hypothetical protein
MELMFGILFLACCVACLSWVALALLIGTMDLISQVMTGDFWGPPRRKTSHLYPASPMQETKVSASSCSQMSSSECGKTTLKQNGS